MNTIPAVFQFHTHDVRIINRDGQPWFVAVDVCNALGYKNVSQTIGDHLDDDEKGVSNGYTLGGEQSLTIISESGLYALVLRSRKPEARKFAKWVTSEVLPAIRKTGSYTAPATVKALPGGLTPNHQDIIKAMVRDRIAALPEERRGGAARALWSALNQKFGTTGMKDGYKNIDDAAFDECVSLLARVPLTGELLPPEQTSIDPQAARDLDNYLKDYGLGVSSALLQLRDLSRLVASLQVNLSGIDSMSECVRQDLKKVA